VISVKEDSYIVTGQDFAYLRSMCRLLVMGNIVSNSPIAVTLMMEALSSSEMSVLTRATQRNIPEDAILHGDCHKNLKSYLPCNNFIALLMFYRHGTESSTSIWNNCKIHCFACIYK
jgi:hypothetical protein